MKRYDQWDQVSPVTEQEDGRFALYDEAQDEFETMAKLCATKIEQQQAEIDELNNLHKVNVRARVNKEQRIQKLQAEIDAIKKEPPYIAGFQAGEKFATEKVQAEIDTLVTALDMLKDKYMAVQYPMMWLHDVVKIDPEVEQADRLTNKYKHKA